MTKFLVLYRADKSALAQMADATPEQARAGMEAWMVWADRAGEAVVDLGSPVTPFSGGSVSGDHIGGYAILQAVSPDALSVVLEGHPHTYVGGTLEVHEILPMPGA